MKPIELDPQNLGASLDQAAAAIPANRPIVMLNLLRYREQADYADSGAARAAISGKQVYFERYLPAFNQIAARSEATRAIRPAFIGSVQTQLIGPTEESWDDVALIEYPSFAAFRAVAESEEYAREASPHRQAALADWRLIALVQQVV